MNNITAAIYIRKSREEKDKPSHRLTVQREQLPAYAQAQGWTVQIYDDGHASAARGKTESLPERARLERDIRAGAINIILCIELSRLSRDDTNQDFNAWLALCRDHGVKLATPGQLIDPNQVDQWVLSSITGIMSAAEMQRIAKRMKDGRQEAYRSGKFGGGVCPPPYVYDKAQGRPVIDQDQLPDMQLIWRLAETMSARQIAVLSGKPEIAVRRMLSDDRLLFYQALREDPQTSELITCDWEPVMTQEQAKRISAARGKRGNHKAGKKEFCALLSNLGIMYCGYCKHTLKTWHNSRVRLDGTRLDYYGCQGDTRNKCTSARLIAQDIVDQAVLTNIFNTLKDLDELKTMWEDQQARLNTGEELQWIIEEEKKTQEKKRRLVTAITAGVMDLADAKDAMAQIKTHLEELHRQKNTTITTMHAPPDWTAMDLSRQEFDRLDKTTRREFIRLVIDRMDVYRMHIIVTYRFPRNLDGDRTAKINLPASQRGTRLDI